MKIPEIKFVCNKCRKRQQPNEKTSNENWKVYDNVPCDCGGKFEVILNERT